MSTSNPRAIDITNIADGDLLRYEADTDEFVKLTPPTVVAFPAAITGGEAPTEAEFLALRTACVDLQAALLAAGLMKAS